MGSNTFLQTQDPIIKKLEGSMGNGNSREIFKCQNPIELRQKPPSLIKVEPISIEDDYPLQVIMKQYETFLFKEQQITKTSNSDVITGVKPVRLSKMDDAQTRSLSSRSSRANFKSILKPRSTAQQHHEARTVRFYHLITVND